MKILMVCLGNICRSPLAEEILRDKALAKGLNWEIDSAGTNGLHDGEPPHPLSQKVAAFYSLDISDQRSRKFKASDMQEFDIIYAMATDVIDGIRRISGEMYQPEKVQLLMNETFPDKDLDVPDPWFGGEEGYHVAYKMMEEACNAIIKKHIQNNS
ncbi:MAG: low molecular weight protein-tyrosine-phosphatase [Chitinophagaceae bacterium]